MSCRNWIKSVRFLFVFFTLLLALSSPASFAAIPLPEMDPAGYPAPNTGCGPLCLFPDSSMKMNRNGYYFDKSAPIFYIKTVHTAEKIGPC